MRTALALLLSTTPAFAEAPSVAADIVPVAALVARVMDGVGAPDLIVPPAASPHGYALRPSEAAALERADLVVRIGPALTPWFEEAVGSLAPDAARLVLLEVPGTVLRALGEGHDHDHDDHAGDHDADDHDDHAKAGGHAHDDDHAHGTHAEEDHDAGHDHAHDGDHDVGHDGFDLDSHAWLDPRNGATWLTAIADSLAAIDPVNAETYRANAEAGRAEIAALEAEIEAVLAVAVGRNYLTLHDAYGYFEDRTGLASSGSIRLSDATESGPAHLEALRSRLEAEDIACLFTEPQLDDRLARRLLEGTDVRLASLDPLGDESHLGQGGYVRFISQMADDMAACLAPGS